AHTLVILGFPYGEASGRLDRIAFAEEQSRGIQTKWREEHVRYGIPGPDVHAAVLAAARSHYPIMRVRWFEHESLFGVKLRSKLRHVIPRESRLYGALFFPFYVFHQTGIRTRGYRRIYVARLKSIRGCLAMNFVLDSRCSPMMMPDLSGNHWFDP